ncbi:hypothetical protein C8R45DRAFT_310160 [Mycena sanguinolenta]|nr:hypothetical protein C8R45DRAFT_310160 [Mycena sanguinolenta]
MVVNVSLKSSSPVGLNMESGRSTLCLVIAFNLNWIYFGSQVQTVYPCHPPLHLPLYMALLFALSAIPHLIASTSTSTSTNSKLGGGLRWVSGAGLSASVWTMATVGLLHKNLDDEEGLTERTTVHSTISGRVVRYAAGLAMTLMPITGDLSSIQFLAICVRNTAFLIMEEIIARIERGDSATLPSYDLAPTNCPRHCERTASCVTRPGAHPACYEGFDESIMKGSKRMVCAKEA